MGGCELRASVTNLSAAIFAAGEGGRYESLSEYRVRGFWPYRLLGGDSLPAMPLGSEGCSSCERDECAEAGSANSSRSLTVPLIALAEYARSAPRHFPMSSFHRSACALMKSRIRPTHSASSSTATLAPCCRKRSSAPRKFRFSPITTRGIRKSNAVPVHMMQGLSVLTSVNSAQSLRRPALRRHTVSACETRKLDSIDALVK